MNHKNGLRTRPSIGLAYELIGLVVFIVLVAGGVVGAVLIHNSRAALRADIFESNLAAADLAAKFAANYLEGAETNVRLFAVRPSFLRAIFDRDVAAAEALMAQFLALDARFDNVAVYDADGIGWTSGLLDKWQYRGGSVADREWFQQTIATRQPHLGIPILSRGTGRPIITYAIPIFNDQDEIRAVFAGGIFGLPRFPMSSPVFA